MQIHLLIDSPFYTDRIIQKMRRFEPDSKVFVVIKSHKEVRILEGEKVKNVSLTGLQSWIHSQLFSSVYIHFLSTTVAYLLHKTQLIKLPCYWIMWGADFYGLSDFSDRYYLPLSRPFAWKNNTWKHKLASFLGMPSSKYVMKVVQQIKYFVGYEEEFTLTQMSMNHKMTFVPWEFYFNMEEMKLPTVNRGTGAVLLGNSDDPMNNHLDVLEKLENLVPADQRIIIPIAGASTEYLEKIKEFQVNSKADIFLQETLMESTSFFKLMDEVSFVVYGHLRQQGVGTLLPLLYQGKKAFLWDENPFKAVLERWDLDISSLNTLKAVDFVKLTDEELYHQRNKLETVLSTEADTKRWNRILNGS